MNRGGKQVVRTSIADHVQHVLGAQSVDVHLAGRASLAERHSLRFVADQAVMRGRPGFAMDGQPEKYQIKGGLADDELDALFRVASGDRAERDLKIIAADWLIGAIVTAPLLVPSPVAALLVEPATVERAMSVAESLTSGRVRQFAESGSVRPEPQLGTLRQNGERALRR